jgi:coenzyme F420-reducing hydrogenase gamma subunit
MDRLRLAVWKFASCDGCQLSLLDCEDELLALAETVEIAHFLEATSRVRPGPYDLSLVEGSITTAHDVERIHEIRGQSHRLVTIGACATAGGIQALRNARDLSALNAAVYPNPEYVEALATSTPISDHVEVDLELHGCPISKAQLLELLLATLAGRAPRLPDTAQCVECKRAGTPCVMVSRGVPCLGPVTRSGCGNLCPKVGRGCYGCFGPVPGADTGALSAQFGALGLSEEERRHLFRGFTCAAPEFRAAGGGDG